MNDLTLTTLAIEINSLHDQASHYAGQAVVYAAKCGAKLNEAKNGKSQKKFIDWLEANTKVKKSQAYNYGCI